MAKTYRYRGKSYSFIDLYRVLNPPMSTTTFRRRLQSGMSIDEAISAPLVSSSEAGRRARRTNIKNGNWWGNTYKQNRAERERTEMDKRGIQAKIQPDGQMGPECSKGVQ